MLGCGSTRAGGVEVLRVLFVCVCLCSAYVACSRICGCATVALVGMGGLKRARESVDKCLTRSSELPVPLAAKRPTAGPRPRHQTAPGGRRGR